jgi:hypothetical protein
MINLQLLLQVNIEKPSAEQILNPLGRPLHGLDGGGGGATAVVVDAAADVVEEAVATEVAVLVMTGGAEEQSEAKTQVPVE